MWTYTVAFFEICGWVDDDAGAGLEAFEHALITVAYFGCDL